MMVIARRFFANESDAEELVNATFAKVIDNIDGFLEQSSLFTWMCQILTNEFRDSVRRKSSKVEVCPGVIPDMVDDGAQDAIYDSLDHSLVRDAISKLDEDDREVLLLHYFMDMPVLKMAKILAMPTGTVKTRLRRARRERLRLLGRRIGHPLGIGRCKSFKTGPLFGECPGRQCRDGASIRGRD